MASRGNDEMEKQKQQQRYKCVTSSLALSSLFVTSHFEGS
jgi:hypothetical protein